MDAKSRQKALDDISPEDLAKIKAHQASTRGHMPVDNEWLIVAEFTLKFGWEAYRDFKADNIQLDEMLTLIEAARRVEYKNMFYDAQAVFIATAASGASKRQAPLFEKLTRKIIELTKADKKADK